MNKQEFYKRFNKKTDKPLERGFCEIEGKRYFCLTNQGQTWQKTPSNSFTYYVFLRAFYDLAISVGEECVYPEFVNVKFENGYIFGDIITEDFSNSEEKIKVLSFNSKPKRKMNGFLIVYDDMTLLDEVIQFEKLAEYYGKPNIYQQYLKHLLFHLYVGDEDFHLKNVEIFFNKDGKFRISPMYDFDLVYYINKNLATGAEGFFYQDVHFMPEFAKREYVAYMKQVYDPKFEEEPTIGNFNESFFIDADVVSKREILFGRSGYDQQELLYKVIKDIEDKEFIERLLDLDIDKCLSDDLYNKEVKTFIKIGTIPTKIIIKKAYEKYKNGICKDNISDGQDDEFIIQ